MYRPTILLLCLAGVLNAQTTFRFYGVPWLNTNAVNIAHHPDQTVLLLNSYCYTPDFFVIEGCPRGFWTINLDQQLDSVWTSPLPYQQAASDLYTDPVDHGVLVFGSSYARGGECNGQPIFQDQFSGISFSIAQLLDNTGATIDTLEWYSGQCYQRYLFAMPVSTGGWMLATQYNETPGISGPAYESFKCYLLDEALQTQQVFEYPDVSYRFISGWTPGADDTAYFTYYNLLTSEYELVKINWKGEKLWSKPVLGNSIYGWRLKELSNGDVLIAAPGSVLGVYFLSRYASDGGLLWSKIFTGKYPSSALAENTDNTLLFGSSVPLQNNNTQLIVRHLDAFGNALDSTYYDVSPGVDNLNAFIDVNGDMCMYGDAFGGLDSLYGPSRAFISDNIATAVQEPVARTRAAAYKVSPNPAVDYIRIQTPSGAPEIRWIKLLDMLGNQLLTTNAERIDISSYPSGVYWVQIMDENQRLSSIKVIKT